jgi:hypothetical protein
LKLNRIGVHAFQNGGTLGSIAIPSSVQTLGSGCFENCGGLATVDFLPESKLVRIDSSAFPRCRLLRSFALPSSVEVLGGHCFDECSSLSSLIFESPAHVRELHSLPPALSGSLDIPDSVENLVIMARTINAVNFGSQSRPRAIQTYNSSLTCGNLGMRLLLWFSSFYLKPRRSGLGFEPELSRDE